MRAITVCVDYSDLLSILLPINRDKFDDYMVVTSMQDERTREVAKENGCRSYSTPAFYENGAYFNKWLALERCFDQVFHRHGTICILDADIILPKTLPTFTYEPGKLYTPRRRMNPDLPKDRGDVRWEDWKKFPSHRNEEFAGYCQIFSADDPVLGPPPWHQIDWKHAGGADSFFQMKWKEEDKIRPPFEVMHFGPPGVNWCGRQSPMTDGTIPSEAAERRKRISEIVAGRHGKKGDDRFAGEKIRPAT